MKLITYSLLAGAVLTLSCTAQADNGYSSSEQNATHNNGYSSSKQTATQNNGYSSTGSIHPRQPMHRKHQDNRFSIFVGTSNAPNYVGGSDTYFVMGRAAPHPSFLPRWVDASTGEPLPRNMVLGGGEANQIFPICRGTFRGGVHPGKIIDGKCDISWGGQEIRLYNYQVLVSGVQLAWAAASYGQIPYNAIEGGYENNGKKLYICQAIFNNNMYPGKIVRNNCNIAWNGKEYSIPNYNVLIR